MGKSTKENQFLLKVIVIFIIVLFAQIAFSKILPCKQVEHIDFKGKSLVIETKDGSVFTRFLTQKEYMDILTDESAQDALVNELVDGMECGKNKISSKNDTNL